MSQTTNNGTRCAEEYTVKRGDSFYLIAHKLGVPLRDLLAANSDIHPARLMVGDVLCIPMEEDDQPEEPQAAPAAIRAVPQAAIRVAIRADPRTTTPVSRPIPRCPARRQNSIPWSRGKRWPICSCAIWSAVIRWRLPIQTSIWIT